MEQLIILTVVMIVFIIICIKIYKDSKNCMKEKTYDMITQEIIEWGGEIVLCKRYYKYIRIINFYRVVGFNLFRNGYDKLKEPEL